MGCLGGGGGGGVQQAKLWQGKTARQMDMVDWAEHNLALDSPGAWGISAQELANLAGYSPTRRCDAYAVATEALGRYTEYMESTSSNAGSTHPHRQGEVPIKLEVYSGDGWLRRIQVATSNSHAVMYGAKPRLAGTTKEFAESAVAYVTNNCTKHPRRILQTHLGYARFLLATDQGGRARATLDEVLRIAPPNGFEYIEALGRMADVYHQAGYFALRDKYRKRATTMGRGKLPPPPQQLPGPDPLLDRDNLIPIRLDILAASRLGRDQAVWGTLLERRMEEASWSDNPDLVEMQQLWTGIQDASFSKLLNPTLRPETTVYPDAIVRLARAGAILEAKRALSAAEASFTASLVVPLAPQITHIELVRARAAINQATGHHIAAADNWLTWAQRELGPHAVKAWSKVRDSISRRDASLRDPKNFDAAVQNSVVKYTAGARPLDRDGLVAVGLAQEKVGRIDLAIEYFQRAVQKSERLRSTYSVESRERFMRGQTIKAYWGLVRCYTRKYAKNKSRTDFDAALVSAQKLTARQFGDVIGVEATKPMPPKLSADEVLVKVVWTDRGLVTFVFGMSKISVVLTEPNMDELKTTARELISMLRSGDNTAWRNQALKLSNTALKSAADELRSAKRITFITDGPLSTIPTNLLSQPGTKYRALIETATVKLSPSLGYVSHRQGRPTKAIQLRGSRALVLANPNYGHRERPSTHILATQDYSRAADQLGLFVALPETEKEVEIMKSAFGADSVTALVGNRASQSSLNSANLGQFQYLHFATHGILGGQIPGVHEPALVLASEANQDGFLTMSEVRALKLRAELTVLSACDTGSGEYFEGEGVMGLGRAFLLAGSKSVLVTYWPIDSLATVTFMGMFYVHLSQGMTKEQALRATQLQSMTSNTKGSAGQRGLIRVTKGKKSRSRPPESQRHPYFWAPFVLIGN